MFLTEWNFPERFSVGFELKATKPVKKSSHQNQMLSNLNSTTLPENVSASQPVLLQPLPTLNESEELKQIAEKRALVIGRLNTAKLCEIIGKKPWISISNSAYKSCEHPCISVVITMFNYSEYIYECLNSVCKSNISGLSGEIEILVIDDCSTDRSASMVEGYLSISSTPICLIKKCFNTGLADARNIGLKAARSSYVFILDADNWIYPNCLSVLYNKIKFSSYAAVYGIIRKFDNQTKKEVSLVSCEEWNVQRLVKAPYIDAMAMINKDIVLKVGGYSTELIEYGWFGWEDYDLWLKLAQLNYSCKLVPEVLSSYRVHSSSMINITDKYRLNFAIYFSKKFSDIVKEYNKLDMLFGVPRSKKQSSKFGKLRNQWFKLKKFFSLAKTQWSDL